MKRQTIITGSILAAVLCSGVFLSSTVNADPPSSTVSKTASVTVSSACTMFGQVNTAHTDTISNGTYKENIGNGKTTITTFCNDTNGYALYAIGFTGDTYTGTDHTKLVTTGSGTNIATGTYTAGTTTDSVWSMKLTAVPGTYAPTISNGTNGTENFTAYHAVPDTFTKVASYPQTTDAVGGTGSKVETAYAVYIGNNQAPGTYTGQVKYVLVHPNTFTAGTYTIAYNANGGTGTMTSSTNLYNFEPFTLPASTLTAPTGYAFAGWCTTNTSQYSCADGTLYQPGDAVTSLATAGGTANLYAVWGPLKSMQSATSADCGQEMVDTRDGNTYTTATIVGLCWMTKNLDLPGGTTLSSDDTNVPDDYSTTTTGFTNGNTLPASSTSGFSSSTTAYVYNSGSTTCDSGSPCYSYYSWRAATAGYTASSGSVSYDICPKGWRLPTSAEFTTLKNTYTTGATLTASPFLGVYAGVYGNSQFSNGGSRGHYWSSTDSDSYDAYRLTFNSSSASVNYTNEYNGYSIRCVAKS